MLEGFRKKYEKENVQYILVDNTGKILESDNVLFDLEKDSLIYDIDPFFESLPFDSVLSEGLDFRCIHLQIKNQSYIVDIRVVHESMGWLLMVTNYTAHYNSYQEITQKRNESVIKSELTILKNLELEERERFKNQFIRNFSHELRNPMASMTAIIDLLEDTSMTDEQIRMFSFLKASNSNLRLMLEDTLSIGMIDAGKIEIQDKLFDLRKLLDLIQFTYKAKAQKAGLAYSIDIDKELPAYVEGDRLRLFQIITNLLDNAIKFTETGGVSLRVSVNQKRANTVNVRFEVEDTGSGISQEQQEVIFDSFYRAPNAKNRQGTGLGLAIVKKLLVLLGSKIQMRSTLNKGSNFYFDITLTYELFSESKQTKSKIEIGKTVSDSKKFKILLVEDDELVQTTLFKMLLNSNKYIIDLAFDGALVLQEVINNSYDLILMDVNLPNLDGIQITRLIREFPFKNISTLPIIGITADGYQEKKEECIKAGMQHVLVKPFDKKALFDTMKKCLK